VAGRQLRHEYSQMIFNVADPTNPYKPPVTVADSIDEATSSRSIYVMGFGAVGFVVGCILALSGILAIETSGRGTQVFLWIYSSPAALGLKGPALLIAMICLWIVLGVLLGIQSATSTRILFFVILAHFGAIPLLWLLNRREFENLDGYRVAWDNGDVVLPAGIATYIASHAFIVSMLFARRQVRRRSKAKI
jgi:hypothetical protein